MVCVTACKKLLTPLLPVVTGDKEAAAQWYKKGIAELERGIAVEITGQGNIHPNKQASHMKMECSVDAL